MGLKKAWREWLGHVARFGVLKGTRIVQLKSQRSSTLATIEVPGSGGPFHVRPGTSDMAIFDEIFYSKYLPRDRSYATVMDCGANIGCTVRYWKLLDPKCTVIAVEPDPENFDLLTKNTAQLKDVHLVKAGIWPTAGALDLAKDGVGHSAVRTTATERGSTPAVTIPGLMQQHGIAHLDLLKIDIEGSELELFTQGDLNWISQVETIAIELHDHWRPGCGDAFFQAIAPYRWTYSIVGYTLVCTRLRDR
ncbi:MAG TPA: FkbM family methyltransferase [Flavobacteriales bacterium]|nr:FkbM family methyltransferase [Flavobacteriales bacterium]